MKYWYFLGFLILAFLSLIYAKIEKPIHLILVKKTKTLSLYRGNSFIKSYQVALGKPGPKEKEGDHKTPEGNYFIDKKNPKSLYHKALHLSYPNSKDLERAKRLHQSAGTDIEIHGLPKAYSYLGKSQSLYDWTFGCIALSDSEIDELYNLVEVGTPILIKP